MSRLPEPIILLFVAISSLHIDQTEAYCSRCVKIEEDRAREQAENPQPFHYFDDRVSLQSGADSQQESRIAISNDAKRSLPRSSDNSTSSSLKSGAEEPSKSNAEDSSRNDKRTHSYFDASLLLKAQSTVEKAFLAAGEASSSVNLGDFFEEDLQNTEKTKVADPSSPQHASQGRKQLSYSTLRTIFKTKDFLETLDGTFTLLLPTNEALQKMPPGKLEELTKPENSEKLSQLISNHVIAKKLLKKDFETYKNKEIKALSGRNLTISINNGNMSIDNAHILLIEPAGYDGVIYIIDRVLE